MRPPAGFGHFRLSSHRRRHSLKAPEDARGTALVGEGNSLLVWERVLARLYIVFHVPCCRLRREPLSDAALRGAGLRSDLGRRARTLAGHRLIETELVSDHDQ